MIIISTVGSHIRISSDSNSCGDGGGGGSSSTSNIIYLMVCIIFLVNLSHINSKIQLTTRFFA
jgi:hypothetical protein